MFASLTPVRVRLHLAILILLLLSSCGPNTSLPLPTSSPPAPGPRAATATKPVETAAAAAATETQAPTRTPLPSRTPTQAPEKAAATPASVEERAAQVESHLIPFLEVAGSPEQSYNLVDRMAYYQVPGVSIAVIQEGQIEWARAYGVARMGADHPLTIEVPFQAASMSKPVTALLALLMAQEGLFDLDDPVNEHLVSWQMPDSEEFSAQEVTIGRVLSHTAGLGLQSFPGYPPGRALPSLPQILNGEAPANSQPLRIIQQPGSRYLYSGGGYVLLQLLLEDVSGQSLDQLAQERIFGPLEMPRSIFAQPLTGPLLDSAAYGYRLAPNPLPGHWQVYPELAPAGLWSTPTDLAQILIEVGRAQEGQGQLLSQEMAARMTTPVLEESGMGFVLPLQADSTTSTLYGHGGSNQGYRGLMYAVRGGQQGAVVMINSESGGELVFEIFRAIAHVYNWPQVEYWKPGQRAEGRFVEIDPKGLPALAGSYQLGRLKFNMIASDGRLWVQIPAGGPSYALFPDSETDFFSEDGTHWIFEKNAAGTVTTLQVRGWGSLEVTARKLP
jgi:CubicO group peptidase (beta-lactamase class C family)